VSESILNTPTESPTAVPTEPTAPTTAPSGFAALGLDPRLVASLTANGYAEPTPVQRESIPHLLAGRDLVGLAATGTGKTAAFALPLIQRIAAARGTNPPTGKPAVIVLVPTRELALQVATAVGKYGHPLGVRVVPVYGGAGFGDQVRGLKRGTDVVVATPGRALDHLRRGTLDLSAVTAAVLDEADEMLDMGFAEDIEAILSAAPKQRQTALFSATMPPRIAAIADAHLSNPVKVAVAKPATPAGEAPKVRQAVFLVDRQHKVNALARVLEYESPTSAIVFCRTRDEADAVADTLTARGRRPEALHGGLSQDQRDRIMRKFRDGAVTLLVATDVAARGLDISHLSHVVNFGVPQAPEVYVHRIGRVGRAGREGVALTIATPGERRMVQAIERLLGQRIEFGRIPAPAAVRAKRLERTRDAVKDLIRTGGLDEYKSVVGELAAEFGPAEVALAAVAMLDRATRSADDDAEIPTFSPAPRDDRRPRQDGPPMRGGPAYGPRRPPMGTAGRGMAKVFVGAGRLEGVDRRQLVTVIENEVGLRSRDIGTITVAERFSLIEVPGEIIDDVIGRLDGVRIRGRRVPVRRDRAMPAAQF
jgi:ATP-dependent RNA helicase DeaD